MAIKYTEEQLNTVDKSIIIQMFLKTKSGKCIGLM